MKKKAVKVVLCVILLFVIVLVLDSNFRLIRKNISQTIPVDIYNDDGIKTGETAITINGTYYAHLFKRDIYVGEFSLPDIPDTEREGTIAEIEWIKRRGYKEEPRIIFYGETVYENIGSIFIDINREMNEIAWWTTKGTIATSFDAYNNYKYFK